MVWPNEKYDLNDAMNLVQLPFEDMMVNVPSNYEYYIKRMYGDDCLVRYVIQEHTDNHSLFEIVPHPKKRMELWESWHRLNQHIGLDRCDSMYGKESNIIISLLATELATPNKNKTRRKMELIARYLNEKVKQLVS